MLKHPNENAQQGDPCAELLQSVVSSGIIIFGLKQSSELACNPGMLRSWEILLMEAGLKKLQMLSQWPWVHWQCFWPFSKGLLAPAMRFWGHLLGWAFPGTPEDTSLGNRRFLCSSCHRNVLLGACLWEGKELGENQCARGCWGSQGESYKAGGQIRYLAHPLPDQHPKHLVYKVLFLWDGGSEDRV